MLTRISPSHWLAAVLCVASLWFLYFFGLTHVGLVGPDEPRYAAIGLSMSQTGDWITPRLWGQPWFEKPPLLYWATATAFKSGLGLELAPRLPVALISVAFLVYFFLELRRHFNERAACLGTLILATSVGWLAYSHVAIPDLPMSAAFSAAMLLLIPGQTLSQSRAASAGVLLGLAILTKGLVPLVLFLPAVWFLRRQIRALVVVLALALVVAAPWYFLVASRNGSAFLSVFFGQQQFARFLSGEFLHVQPFWYYVPVLAAGFFPWTPLLLLLFSKPNFRDHRAVYLLAWFAFGFIFFSASRGKLPHYLLPLLPALAALIGVALDRARERGAAIAGLLAASAALFWLLPTAQDALPQALTSGLGRAPIHFSLSWLAPAALLAVACGLLEMRGERVGAAVVISLATGILLVRFLLINLPQIDHQISARDRWIASSESISCIPADSSFLRYGLDYYAGRELPNCQ